MGLYDRILIEVECPLCGQVIDEWQTKDLEKLMRSYTIGDKVETNWREIRVYSYCPHRITQSYSKELELWVYDVLWSVSMDIYIDVSDGVISTPDRWEMVARINDFGPALLGFHEVDVEEFNRKKRDEELKRFGEIEDLRKDWMKKFDLELRVIPHLVTQVD